MNMKNAVSIVFGLLGILSLFTLQSETVSENSTMILSIVLSLVIAAGVWFTDIRKKFYLSRFWINFYIIVVILWHLRSLVNSPIEFIAFSIANILSYVLAILYFRKKNYEVRIHLMTISFILVCVGVVSSQSIAFALILIAYFLTLVGAISLFLLQQEQYYYETHAFIRPAFGRDKKDRKPKRFHLLRLALGALFLTPFYLLFGYRSKEKEPEFRPLDLDESSDSSVSKTLDFTSTMSSKGDRIFGYWESPDDYSLPVPHNQTILDKRKTPSIQVQAQYELLSQSPIFSGASRTDKESMFPTKIIGQLLISILSSLVFALLVFYFFPRFQRLEFGDYEVGHDGWHTRISSVLSTVGFNEKMYLGELGPTYDNHRKVLGIRFLNPIDNTNYKLQETSPIYLRGVTLVHYEDRQWSRSFIRDEMLQTQRNHLYYFQRPCNIFYSLDKAKNEGLFNPQNGMILQEIDVEAITTNVIFSVWPFFRVSNEFDEGFFDGNWFINRSRHPDSVSRYHLYTNAFSHGTQVDLIPNQEYIEFKDLLLEISKEKLPELIKLAEQWDKESGIPKENYINRARYIESQLRDSGRFTYTRLGVSRNRKKDPLEDFVTEHPTGHCEYYAGVLAMMLRAINIPSRIIIGFKYYPIEESADGFCTIRQSDAHSWVEALIPNDNLVAAAQDNTLRQSYQNSEWWKYGAWLRLDATPYTDDPIMTVMSKKYLNMSENVSGFWKHYVLNFNSHSQQGTVYDPCKRIFEMIKERYFNQNFWVNFLPNLKLSWSRFMESIKGGKWSTAEFLALFIPLTIILLLLILIILLTWRLIVILQRKRLQREEEKTYRTSFYGRLEKLFAHWGIYRKKTETSREFVVRGINDVKINEAMKLLSEWNCRGDSFWDQSVTTISFCTQNEDIITDELQYQRTEIFKQAMEIVNDWYRIRFGQEESEKKINNVKSGNI